MITVSSSDTYVLAAGIVESGPLVSFAWIMSGAVLAPFVSWMTGRKIPAVVLLIGYGILIGPYWLGLASTEGGVGLLKQLGLGMLFLLAGYEINPQTLRSKEGRSAASTWIICMILSFAGAFLLLNPDNASTAVALAIAVTSTAVGTLMPIMKQQDTLHKPVGKSLLVHGAIGEVLPILAMALLLSARATWVTAVVLFGFFLIAGIVAMIPRTVQFFLPWMHKAMVDEAGSTNQTVLRLVLWMLGILMAVAAVFELDVVLGAFAAGVILHQMVPEKYQTAMEQRLDIVGYSLLIPVFFICSGMSIDPKAVLNNPWMLVILVPLIYVTRGLPVLLRELFGNTGSSLGSVREKIQLSLYTATALPIIVAVTEVAVASDLLSDENASLLVAAGSATVLLFPLLAHVLKPRGEKSAVSTDNTVEESAAPHSD
ncbi:MAG: cation:proton antiporter [Corynebacterium sp.]|uniref:cation:proton antiporter n=1 Tax=Corynebacterium sp. TaxID=1720 RepID=UPI0026DC6905|nr:cation:proton antiporter [Corynebacterium sp.]MDO5097337.1 cation:proton antiporter [Corynebacterium sp.]